MDEIEQSNKVRILEELRKNGRISLSELAEKTGLSRQTIAKTINNLEKNKQIWGYTAIFDPKLVGKKQFIFLVKLDLSVNTEEFIKMVTNPRQIKDNVEVYGFETTMFLNGSSDLIILIWAKDIIEAKKHTNSFMKLFKPYVRNVELFDVMATFRNNGIANPKMIDEWTNLLI